MGFRHRLLCCLVIAIFVLVVSVTSKRPKKKATKKPSNETSFLNFLRLLVLRLVYGFATMIGAEEGVSEFMGGALVPPGVDDGDYKDYWDGDENDDY